MSAQREVFASRLGFLLISAGCAIGLGNVWRFPYITGVYGGAAFVMIYLAFLVLLGLPILIMELSIGRASKLNIGGAIKKLEPKGTHWHIYGHFAILGNYLLMMFYTTICGWMLAYTYHTITGDLSGLAPEQVGAFFGELSTSLDKQIFWMFISVLFGSFVCALGVRNGIERITKIMMGGMFVIMVALALRAMTLDNASEGLKFYLMPDFSKITEMGVWNTVYAAMGQAFFTLSVGIGSMAIFGSYIDKDHSLTGEGLSILGLDTMAALLAGCIIFPSCFAFDINPGQGPGLIFVTLPNVFNSMLGGQIWGILFFTFMAFAALSTVVAVFENIISYGVDVWGLKRSTSAGINFVLIFLLSLPCIFGFSIWSDFQPLGPNTGVLDLEDFIVSNTLLPIGSLIYLFFCVTRYGWGWDNFIEEVDAGKGLKFPKSARFYLVYILPLIILFVFIKGYIDKLF